MMATDLSFVDKAETAWATIGGAPDWVIELAACADRERLRGAAGAIGYSTAVVSLVLVGTYTGDLGKVEEKVRGALMGATVECPVLGTMSRDACIDWQSKPLAATSSLRTSMYRACRSGCRHFRGKEGGNG